MEKKVFDPNEWINQVEQKQVPERGGDGNGSNVDSNSSDVSGVVSEATDDVESVIKNIEEKKVDITARYAQWRNIGFALASAFGEEGRSYFHRVSCFYPGYTKAESDWQYSSCLKGKGNGITLKSFFYYAKESGIDIGGIGRQEEVAGEDQLGDEMKEVHQREVDGEEVKEQRPIEDERKVAGRMSGQGGKQNVANGRNRQTVDERTAGGQDPEEECMPNIPASVYADLPEFLKQVVAYAASNEERDLLLLGSLVALSACLPTFYGIYDGKKVYPNMYLFLTAKASAGKGRLVHCKQLVLPIHYHLRDQAKLLKKEHELLLAEYNQLKNSEGGEKPNRPPEKMLFIPANNSTTGVFQLLHENEGRGIIFETEGDTLAQAFKSDYGNYSDGFRKAFHHETISYYRRTDREYVDIESPCISTILSGTPKQVSALIPNAENGLFSRFIFYYMNIQPVWKDVFAYSAEEESLDAYFKRLGGEFFGLYKQLQEHEEVQFVLTPEQQGQFNGFFTIVQDAYVSLKGIDYLATVRRLGLIAFRVSMIFSALRLMEHGVIPKQLVCEDRDFQMALSMVRVLVKHAAKVYSELPEEEPLPKRSNRKEGFFKRLPEVFSRKDFRTIAYRMGIPDRTADRYIYEFCKSRILSNDEWGQYQKVFEMQI
ncbi:DUF3987 domain-containing protein [Chitinophagaceae bacterium LB-8]|uniref:DUF3987 domain-containing protein n=1 Tax=Paraflavisolibacter caeni TaxID=2982496 RepID=A0A9X2XZT6_9BACT|nr:DUF3987 domain-containing protein [Paraflavisolibacter caeni]MCU7551956.1 DUF3987 domain-containing protein [Paraflavisolibacter caeni]